MQICDVLVAVAVPIDLQPATCKLDPPFFFSGTESDSSKKNMDVAFLYSPKVRRTLLRIAPLAKKITTAPLGLSETRVTIGNW